MRKMALVIALLFILSAIAPARADAAPPAYPPGFNPAPGSEQTQVRMESESVRLNIREADGGEEMGFADVQALFNMKNLGSTDERMAVRFPAAVGNGWFGVTPVQDISVKVNGTPSNTRRISGEDPNGFEKAVDWVEFDVLFPAGQPVKIEVAYTLEASGEMPYIWFQYIFSSGAGWKGTIGSADLIVNLPYQVDELFLLPCIDDITNCTTPGWVKEGKTLTWQYHDFEPKPEDNFTISLVAPSVWKQVLKERARVETAPKDGEAWGRLGKLYKTLLFSPHGRRGFRTWHSQADPGVRGLFQLSDEAYTKAIDLLPQDALWHAGYADLLAYYAVYAGYEGEPTLPLKLKALEQIHLALQLAPDDETVKGIAVDLAWLMEEGIVEVDERFDFPWLTQTPVPTAVQFEPLLDGVTPTLQPLITKTMSPPVVASAAPLQTAAAESPENELNRRSGTPFCGGALLIPLLLVTGGKLFQIRKDRGSD